MSLPIRFRNVHYYRIAGKYIFAGDLFISRGQLYFFPETDLEEQRSEMTRHVPHNFAVLVLGIVYLAQQLSGAYSSRIQFWQEGVSDENLRMEVNAYIEKLKIQRSQAQFGRTLPLPMRVGVSEISGMKLSSTGKLSFSAQSDKHDFNIGLFRKNRLRDALWEAGLGRL
jgi:hypothetical protein